MTFRRTAVVVTLLVAVTAAVYAAGRRSTPLRPGEYEVEGKIFGMPEAEVFTDEYAGPPVVGDYVTHLPNLAVLPPGNRTHDVRMDIVAQQIEIAPGVRYDAWTFGGSVPGKFIRVRQGDLVVSGQFYGRIKAMFNERNKRLDEAGPSTPALILGLNGAPQAGEKFRV